MTVHENYFLGTYFKSTIISPPLKVALIIELLLYRLQSNST